MTATHIQPPTAPIRMTSRYTLSLTTSQRNAIAGYMFTLPATIGFFVFVLGPMLATLFISFTDWPIIGKLKWVGLENYTTLFTTHPFFWKSLEVTTYFSLASIFLRLIYAFSIASLLNFDVRGKALYRTLFYMPSIVPIVATAMIWAWIYNPDFGLFNWILKSVGLPPSRWLSGSDTAIPSMIFMDVWASSSTIIIFLAGLQGVPRELLEAVEVDGGNWWNKLTAVTMPHMSPYILFNLILGFIAAFQVFSNSYVMTGGGPSNSTLFLVLLIYREAFNNNGNMGLACAIAWLLFVLVAAITGLLFQGSRRWVYYYGEDR